MPQLIRLNIPFIVLLLIAAFSLTVVYLFYLRTNPPVNSFWKWTLIFLRSAVLFLIIVLFFTPTLYLFYYQKQYQKMAVFIDNSRSMNVKENSRRRWNEVKKAVQALKAALSGQQNVQWFVFNSQLKKILLPDSLRPSEGGTNFTPVLKYIQKERFNKVFILSDGVNTEGGYGGDFNVSGQTEIFTIPVGLFKKESDVFVQNVDYRPLTYKGEKQIITGVIGSSHLKKPAVVVIKLLSKNRVLANRTLTLRAGHGLYRVPLSYVPLNKGLQELRIMVEGFKNDANAYNNDFRFVQEVAKSRINIGLFSSAPNYDVKFLRLLLRQNPKFSVSWYVEDNQGRFLQKSDLRDLDSLDVLFLVDYPGPRTSGMMIERLNELWQKRHPSVALMDGRQMNWRALYRIIKNIPFKPLTMEKKEKQITVLPESGPEAWGFLNVFPDAALNQRFWSRIPPLTNYFHRLQILGKPRVLLFAMYNAQMFPVIFTFEQPNYKLLVMNGSNFWRWHFLMQSDPEISSGYRIFLEKLINWLANKKKFKPVLLTANNHTGHLGENFDLTVQLFDTRFKPIKNGSVILNARVGNQSFNLSAQQSETGQFKAQFVPPTSGTFKIVASGFQQDQPLGKDSLRIAVVPVNKELIHLSPDTLFLSQLAQNSGGKMLSLKELPKLRQMIQTNPKRILREKKIEIWYRPIVLILILLLILLEWALRKKLNLV